MRRPSRPGRHLQIGRLELDLRGIAPGTAQASVRELGPALARALTQGAGSGIRHSRFGPIDRIDAGRVDSPVSPDAHDLAVRVAQRIAQALGREE